MGTEAVLEIKAELVPLRVDQNGDVRVGQTHVLLDLIIGAFLEGATPEQIVQDFDTLTLVEVYAVIAYYLRHRAEVDAYVAARERRADEVERKIRASQPDMGDIRARLLARRAAKEAGHVAPRQ